MEPEKFIDKIKELNKTNPRLAVRLIFNSFLYQKPFNDNLQDIFCLVDPLVFDLTVSLSFLVIAKRHIELKQQHIRIYNELKTHLNSIKQEKYVKELLRGLEP